jgi:hypothetical protein
VGGRFTPLANESDLPSPNVLVGMRSKPLLMVLASLAVIAVFFFLNSIGWPGLHWDAAFFAPVVTNVASGKGWIFDGYLAFLFLHGNNIYDFHGVLQPLIYGGLFRASSMASLLAWMSIINAATYIAYAVLFFLILKRNRRISFWKPLVFAVVPGVIVLGLQGRPEQLLPLLFSLPLLGAELGASSAVVFLLLPIISALACLTSPLPGLVYGVFCFVIMMAKGFSPAASRRSAYAFGIGALVALLMAMAAFQIFVPFGLVHWIQNIAFAGKSALNELPKTLNFRAGRWGYTLPSPATNLMVVSASLLFLLELLVRRKVLSFLVLASVLYWSSATMGDYGYVTFVPLVLAFMLDADLVSRFTLSSVLKPRFLSRAALAISFLYLYIFGLYSFIGIGHFTSSSTYPQAASFLRRAGVVAEHPGRLHSPADVIGYPEVMAPSLVLLSDPHSSLTTAEADSGDQAVAGFIKKRSGPQKSGWLLRYESMTGKRIRYYLHPQQYPFLPKDLPATVNLDDQKFDLLDNAWKDRFSFFERLPMPRSFPSSYRLAIYQRRS